MSVSETNLYKKIPMEFNKKGLKLPKNDAVATYEMKKPSNIAQKLALPEVRLDLKEKGDMFQFEIMHKIRHMNILRVEGIQEIVVTRQSLFGVFVEPHSGPLIACLKKLVADKITESLPSQSLRHLVRQMVLVVEALRINGMYHGNLSVNNICYSIENDAIIIKLLNFRQKDEGTELEIAQLLDWVGLGNVIAYISNAAKKMNNNLSCSVIDHLALKLQGLTDVTSLPNLKNDTLSDPFFWDPRKRSSFYIHDLERALKDEAFLASLRNYAHWDLPWDNSPIDGVIAAMNDYRARVLRKDPYNGQDPVAYVMCMSGAYTHQEELVGKVVDSEGTRLSVDAAVQKNRPNLCLTLYRLLTGEIAAEEEAAAAEEEEEEEAAAAAAAAAAAVVDGEMNEDEAAAAVVDGEMNEDEAN